jgi:hypothetical protein
VVEHVPPVPVLGLLLWIDACFFMGLFFLIAGLFTPGSVDRKGVGPYVHDRRRRLGLPLLLGLFVLLPPLGWYAHVHNRHLGWVSYPDYFVRCWLGVGGRPVDWAAARFPDMNLGHLWFVEHLLVYAFLYGAWRSLRPKPGRATGSPPGDLSIALYAVGLGIATWAMRLWWPMNAWTALLGFIQLEPAHLPQYASLFVIGIVAARRGWFERLPAATGRRWLRIGLATIAVATVRAGIAGGIAVDALDWCLLEALICTGLSVGLLATCRDRWNRRTWLTRLGPDTYAVYVFHYDVVVALHVVLLAAPLGTMAKAAIAVSAGIGLSFALGRLVRRLPGATAVF